MEEKKRWYSVPGEVIRIVNAHHVGAYAAQAAYFFVLSFIPIIILLLTLVQFTPLTRSDVLHAVLSVFPESADGLLRSIVGQAYTVSGTIIPITLVIVFWSAGRGVLAVTSGLNSVCGSEETRGYLYLRIRASLYTVLFIFVIIFSLLLSVFGNSILLFLDERSTLLHHITGFIMDMRVVITIVVLTIFWDIVYKYLPNRKGWEKTSFRKQFAGALFTACSWQFISFLFSVYLNVFTGFSTIYGSLTTIILIMLWLYMCMYAIFLGEEINVLLEARAIARS